MINKINSRKHISYICIIFLYSIAVFLISIPVKHILKCQYSTALFIRNK